MTTPDSNAGATNAACAVVGGGPAGAVLAYMLARAGVDVVLLEMHRDFDRDFRGDTLHPSTLEVMDELGLADGLLQLPHTKISRASLPTLRGTVNVLDLSRLHTKYPYITLMPQARFLDYVTGEARHFPCFRVLMGARVDRLIEEDGAVRGVRYQRDGTDHELRTTLTVGADGRFSTLRKVSGLGEAAVRASAPMDVLWFRLTRQPDERHGVLGRFGRGHLLIQLDRDTQWQMGMVIPKDTFSALRAAGIESFRHRVAETAPELAGRLAELHDWKQTSLLSVQADRLTRWHRPGLLLIGDAAHVMSPAGGNGINYAIMDAVATANLLSEPLQHEGVTDDDLALVQRRRERPTRIIQAVVNVIQERVLRPALDSSESFQVPGIMTLPLVGNLAARMMGFGIGREHVRIPR